MPTKTPPGMVDRIVTLRWRRLGPAQIAGELAMAPSTVHTVLVRCRLNKLCHIDRVTGEPIRRYEHDHRVRRSMSTLRCSATSRPVEGTSSSADNRARPPRMHRRAGPVNAVADTGLDDHSRVAHIEICADDKAVTAAGVLGRAIAW